MSYYLNRRYALAIGSSSKQTLPHTSKMLQVNAELMGANMVSCCVGLLSAASSPLCCTHPNFPCQWQFTQLWQVKSKGEPCHFAACQIEASNQAISKQVREERSDISGDDITTDERRGEER